MPTLAVPSRHFHQDSVFFSTSVSVSPFLKVSSAGAPASTASRQSASSELRGASPPPLVARAA